MVVYSKTPTGKQPKGTVGIESFRGRLRLRLPRSLYDGKQKYLTTELLDNSEGWEVAKALVATIEDDIRQDLIIPGTFDYSLVKYGRQPSQAQLTVIESIKPKPAYDLGELWEKYSEFKKPQVSPSTYAKDFTKHRNHISKLPTKSLEDAVTIRDYLVHNLSADAARRVLTQIKACCDWAIDANLIEVNPFSRMTIKVPKGLSEEADVNPFTKEERDLIIQTFAKSRYYSHYTPYVRFLFFTGCRPSEAIGLQWQHIENGVIRFRQAVVISENGLTTKDGLKTQRKRDFPITDEVQAILESVKPKVANPEEFIFKSPQGKFIDQHNFSTRAWKSILEECKVPYRKAYQTRHTFISLCVENHINSAAIGRWTGTSAKMIDNHYGATNFTNLRPPSLK